MTFLDFITPINLSEEREKFFNSQSYNPFLKYSWTKEEAVKCLKTIPKYHNLFSAIIEQNHDSIVQNSKIVFATEIEKGVLGYALEIVKQELPDIEKGTLEELKKEFERALNLFNLDYQIEIVEKDSFNIRPVPQKRLIKISHNPSLQFFRVDDLVRHEMLHIIRWENGRFNNIEKSANYLPTEEGFASFVQDYKKGKPTSSLFQHAAEYAATEVALKGSFRDVFEYLKSIGFDDDNAWKRGIRHKYGFIDTSLPGDIVKPSMYFYNEEKIRNLKTENIQALFVGKITIDEINSYRPYKGKFELDIMTSYFLDSN